jgi:hypothetical protein
MITQPVITVVVAVEHGHHRLRREASDHPDGHLADLQRATGVHHHHTTGADGEDDIGHEAAIFRSGESIGGLNHPHARRQLHGRQVRHR